MARVDFYILNGNTPSARFSCKLASKAHHQGNTVYILAADRAEAAQLDDLLWTFQDTSFVPHACVDVAAPGTPVVIGWPEAQAPQTDVFINLTDTIPASSQGFNRLVEIIADEATQRERGRARYKTYREQGYEMNNHTISPEQASA